MSILSVSIENKDNISMLLDKEDLGLLTQHKKGHWCFLVDSIGYAFLKHKKGIGGDGKFIPFHRLIMEVPVGSGVNHVNGNGLDNRKENLQICTECEYTKKGTGFGYSKLKGVCRSGKKWSATLNHKYVAIHLGTFDTEIKAALAYDAAIQKLKIKR